MATCTRAEHRRDLLIVADCVDEWTGRFVEFLPCSVPEGILYSICGEQHRVCQEYALKIDVMPHWAGRCNVLRHHMSTNVVQRSPPIPPCTPSEYIFWPGCHDHEQHVFLVDSTFSTAGAYCNTSLPRRQVVDWPSQQRRRISPGDPR